MKSFLTYNRVRHLPGVSLLHRRVKQVIERRLGEPTNGVFVRHGALSGYKFCFDPSTDRSWLFRWLGLHEMPVQKAIHEFVRPNWIAYDIGAHVGFYILLLAKEISETGHIYGFEPDPSNFRLLQRNVELNELTRKVDILNVGLSQSEGAASLALGVGSGRSQLLPQKEGEVVLETIDGLILRGALKPPNFVLVDTEGAESSVLSGALSTLRKHKPILVLEHHGETNLIALVESLNYNVGELGPSHLLCVPKSIRDQSTK